MSPEITRWLLAFVAALIIASTARVRRSLSIDGMFAAIAMGTILVGTAGWWAGILVVAFFASSSIFSRVGTGRSTITQARGAERDAVQVLANGGIALLATIAFSLRDSCPWIVALSGSIAAANADTWSTEIGRTSRSLPRLITTGRTVPAGTSGAVSKRGLLAALGGGALIGTLAAIGWQTGWLPGNVSALAGLVAITLGGFVGSLVDSLLGATVQDQRWCDTCHKATEQRIHRCGTPTRRLRGFPWLNNDVVNLLCTATGGAIASTLWLLF